MTIIIQLILKALIALGLKLLTESFIRDVILMIIEKIAAKTDSKLDDEFLEYIKKAWK